MLRNCSGFKFLLVFRTMIDGATVIHIIVLSSHLESSFSSFVLLMYFLYYTQFKFARICTCRNSVSVFVFCFKNFCVVSFDGVVLRMFVRSHVDLTNCSSVIYFIL